MTNAKLDAKTALKIRRATQGYSGETVEYRSGVVLHITASGFTLRDTRSKLWLVDASEIARDGFITVNAYTTIRDVLERPHHVYRRAAMVDKAAVYDNRDEAKEKVADSKRRSCKSVKNGLQP